MSSQPQLTKLGLGLDYHADVFRYEDKVLRAIRPAYEDFFAELAEHRVVRELEADGLLLPTKRSSLPMDGYNLVLEQPFLPCVTFPFEWTPTMFKEAAKTILKINIRLVQAGYCTQDGHPWNILFDGTHPRFIDFTSIVRLPSHGKWEGIEEFDHCCMSPLKLMAKGYPTVARMLSREVRTYPDTALANAVFFNTKRYMRYPKLLGDLAKIGDIFSHFGGKATGRIAFRLRGGDSMASVGRMHQLLKKLDSMDVSPPSEMWSDYYGTSTDYPSYTGKREQLDAVKKLTPKHSTITKLLQQIRPKTVLDIACNRGIYSQLAAVEGARVIGIDNDEQALDLMYRDSIALGTNTIPLFVNVVTPAEAVGFHTRPLPSVTERLSSECVLCLALVHHLVFKSPHITFPHIAEILSSFAKKHLIVEFIPREDKYLQESLKKRSAEFRERFEWYSLDNFKDSLKAHFASIQELESHPSPRVMLFCSKE